MSEILVRMKVDVWKSEKPEVSWVEVKEIRGGYVRFDTLHVFKDKRSNKSETVKAEHSFHRARLERVEPIGKRGEIDPGRVVIHWLQDDREPIVGGEKYKMALFNVLEAVNADMREAAVRISEMEQELDGWLDGRG